MQNIIIDASHGINGPYNTLFRNRAVSYGMFISPGAGNSTNIVSNEITGTGFQKGNYYVPGLDNLEYGNNKNDTILPAGGTMLTDKSYVYIATPAFWNVTALWPTVGIPNVLNAGTIPAKERFAAGADLSFCLSILPVTYTFTGNGNWTVAANWSNNMIPPSVLSDGSEIIIDPIAGGKCVLNISYIINPAARLTVKPGKHFEVLTNLTLVK